MSGLSELPELQAIDSRDRLIRIPSEQDVPVTPRIRALIDSTPFRRLSQISQLGLVQLVYPGATHSRFEHSLGVYRMALHFLRRLLTQSDFCEIVTRPNAECFLIAALLHDVGHWPYCHPVEDMQLDGTASHESLAGNWIAQPEISEIINDRFECSADEVIKLLNGKLDGPSGPVLDSMLSGPIDVDKTDYLYRDSLHAGVPYGMHFDTSRLIGSLCLDESRTRLAITEKGCTAAELMVFARYVMFREVYWHHAVRSATAMLQRAFFELRSRLTFQPITAQSDTEFQSTLQRLAEGTPASRLADGLFGTRRSLYKRLAQYSYLEHPETFDRISRQPFAWLVECGNQLAQQIRRMTGVDLHPGDILIDAPPVNLEVQFHIDVRGKFGNYRPLIEESPVVKTLAREQFDNFVKQIRVFVNPDIPCPWDTIDIHQCVWDAAEITASD